MSENIKINTFMKAKPILFKPLTHMVAIENLTKKWKILHICNNHFWRIKPIVSHMDGGVHVGN